VKTVGVFLHCRGQIISCCQQSLWHTVDSSHGGRIGGGHSGITVADRWQEDSIRFDAVPYLALDHASLHGETASVHDNQSSALLSHYMLIISIYTFREL
jgi:hypothetical protein